WSNLAAAAGGSPCVPFPAGLPYVNVSSPPRFQVDAGSTVNVQVTGWSTAAVEPWAVVATLGPRDFDPQVALDGSTISNGSALTLTAQIPAAAHGGATVFVESRLPVTPDGVGSSSIWPIVFIV